MAPAFPKAGPLSSMIIVGLAAGAALVVGWFVPSLHDIFAAEPDQGLLDALMVTVVAMIVHKGESYRLREWDRCPVYQTSTREPWAADRGQLLFLGFVPTFLGLLLLFALVLRGPPWPLLLLSLWSVQGLHEVHHVAKTAVERSYYPGTASAVLFVASIDALLVPRLVEHLALDSSWPLAAFYVLQAVMLIAYVVEHGRWRTRFLAWKSEAGPAVGSAADHG